MSLLYFPVTADLEFDCSNYETIAPVMMEAIEATVAMGHAHPWSGYLAITKAEVVVGICAFKGPPNEAGEVEIAWFTFPPYENRGYGNQMAAYLVSIAQQHPDQVTRVVAHTEPAKKASAKICEKIGMTLQGEYDHPQDGTVWYWTRDLV